MLQRTRAKEKEGQCRFIVFANEYIITLQKWQIILCTIEENRPDSNHIVQSREKTYLILWISKVTKLVTVERKYAQVQNYEVDM